MSLKLIILAAFAATAQAAACTADDTKAMSECTTAQAAFADDANDKDKICPYVQELLACYPSCYCDDANNKATMDKSIKQLEDSIKKMHALSCPLKCGATSSSMSSTCSDCVAKGWTFCQADSFFGGKDQCVKDATSGFFGDCGDVEFGADSLTSDLDCTFGSENGEGILVAIIVVISLVVLGCVQRRKRQARMNGMMGQAVQQVAQVNVNSQQMGMQMAPAGQVLGVMQPQQMMPQQMMPQQMMPQQMMPQQMMPQQQMYLAPSQMQQQQQPYAGGIQIVQPIPVQPIPIDPNNYNMQSGYASQQQGGMMQPVPVPVQVAKHL